MKKLLLLCVFLPIFGKGDDSFTEELYVRDLGRGYVSLHFNFNILQKTLQPSITQHYHLFPKSLGEILHKYDVSEMHLSLVRGYWDTANWGYAHSFEPPGAAELWAWFAPPVRNVDRSWKSLANALSGHFCASLNFLGQEQAFASPQWSYRPTGLGASSWANAPGRFLRQALLSRETVCTENLTPWLKLLPCKQSAGLGQLLNPVKLYATSYHALTVHVRPVCWDKACSTIGRELRQTLTVVFDRRLHTHGSNNWSLTGVLNRALTAACPLAKASHVFVEVPNKAFDLHPAPTAMHSSPGAPDIAEYDLKELLRPHSAVDIVFSFPEDRRVIGKSQSSKSGTEPWSFVPLTAQKFATGLGNKEGGVRCVLRNLDPTQHFRVLYYDVIPWYFRPHLRSLWISVNGRKRRPSRIRFRPGRDRQRSYQLELLLELPPGAVLEVCYRFTKVLMRWSDYPPDANRGSFLPAAAISFVLPRARATSRQLPPWTGSFRDLIHNTSQSSGTQQRTFVRFFTTPLLVTLPTPDFSMPFNALCLACTVIAIGVGTVHNFTTRPLVGVDSRVKLSVGQRLKKMLGFGKSSLPEEVGAKTE